MEFPEAIRLQAFHFRIANYQIHITRSRIRQSGSSIQQPTIANQYPTYNLQLRKASFQHLTGSMGRATITAWWHNLLITTVNFHPPQNNNAAHSRSRWARASAGMREWALLQPSDSGVDAGRRPRPAADAAGRAVHRQAQPRLFAAGGRPPRGRPPLSLWAAEGRPGSRRWLQRGRP